jgi:NDP-sugar pyrophosphorylase family protein
VGEDALVSRSVAWNRCRIGAGAVVDGCVLADDASVAPRARLFHAFKVQGADSRRPLSEAGSPPRADAADPVPDPVLT